MISRGQFHSKTHFFLALLVAFCLPIARLTPIFIVALVINWVLEGDFKNKFKTVLQNKFACLFIGFYLLHIIGLIYTQDMASGLFDIQVKSSLLIFPLIICSRPFDVRQTTLVFYALIAGALTSSLILLSVASYHYFVFGEHLFFYGEFSILTHPSYLSMYLNVVMLWIMIDLSHEKERTSLPIVFSVFLLLFFSVIIFLLSSKMGLFNLLLIYIGFFLYFIISRKKYLLGVLGIIAVVFSIYLAIRYVPDVTNRVKRSISAFTSPGIDHTESESTAVRLLVWKAARVVISENPLLGVGTGDVKNELMKEYSKEGLTGALEHKLNTHNAFYQVFAALGIIGFISLVAVFIVPLVASFKSVHIMYSLFLLLVILNFLTESMLETQAGVMFYAFFNSILCFCGFAGLQKRFLKKRNNLDENSGKI